MKRRIKKLEKSVLIVAFLCVASSFNVFAADENNVLKIYNQGVELQNEENWYGSAQYYLEVVNINPAFSDAWFRLAECSYRLGEYNLALDYLKNAEKYEKNNSNVQNLKGMILLALGKTEEAKTIFNEILKRFPNDIDSHFGLAEIELYDGKFSGAEHQYSEALKRQNTNRRALLALAVLCAETNRFTQSEMYIKQAMQYYSGEHEVHYLAAIIRMMQGDYKNAEKHARIAVEIKGSYEKAYRLLANIMYMQNRYVEVVDLCDYLIATNRKNSDAWYLKGIAENKLGKTSDAIKTWSTGLEINPNDEIMRMLLELTVKDNLELNDSRRAEWAKYHINNAVQYESRYDKAGSTYEYQRALMLNPTDSTARLAYANVLELNGMHEFYLAQLKFIKDTSDSKLPRSLEDTIEAYNSLLTNTLAKKWNIDTFYLDKIRWNIAVFYEENHSTFNHADSDRITALACGDIFSGIAITSVKTQVTPVNNYAEAFKNARQNNFDYFILVSLDESDDELTLSADMYSAKTGTKTFSKKYYATGNNRFSTVLRRFRSSVLDKLTVRGKILKRNGKVAVIDLGRSENIVKDAEFKIIKKDGLKISDSGSGLFYKDSDVVGTLSVTQAGEEISEANITSHGFYDKINEEDEVVLVKMPENKSGAEDGIDTVPNAAENGNQVVNNEVKDFDGKALVNEIKHVVEKPAIVELLRSIY